MKQKAPHRLLFVCTTLAMGGAERVMLDLLRHLDRNRFTISLAFFREEAGARELVPPDVIFYKLGKKHKSDFLRLIPALLRVFRTCRPELVLSFMEYANYVTLLAGKLFSSKPPILISIHNYLSRHHRFKGKRGLRRLLIRLLYPGAAGIIAVSRGIAGDVIRHYACPAAKIHVIHNGVDIAAIKHLAQAETAAEGFRNFQGTKILACGRLSYQKNFGLLIRAFAALAERDKTRLYLLGEGTEKKALVQLAADLGISGQVIFLGFQTNPFCYLARSDLFVLSSRYEGFGNVLIEAMACGTAVIAVDCPHGPAEILADPAWGLLIPPQDTAALTRGMQKLLEDTSLRAGLARGGQKRAGDFNITRITEKYTALFSTYLHQAQK